MTEKIEKACVESPSGSQRAYGGESETQDLDARRHGEPLSVRGEFITVDGREGEVLEANQLAAVWEIIQWLHQRSQHTT